MRGQAPRRVPWRDWQVQLLVEYYPSLPTAWIAESFGVAVGAVYHKAQALGLKKSPEFLSSELAGRLDGERGAAARFRPGHTPWNKGKPGVTGAHPNTRRHHFRAGEMRGAAQHNYVPIGSTRVTNGYLQVKVTDDHPVPARRWVSAHRLAWEAAQGPIPPGHVVAFRPGQRTTDRALITVDRLELITHAENMRRNTIHNYPPEIVDAVRARAALNRRINREQQDHR